MNLTKDSKSFGTRKISSITRLKNGETSIVLDIRGDDEVVEKLEVMGIRPGIALKKVSSSLFRGPIILEFDFMQVALGYDMASKIFVEQFV